MLTEAECQAVASKLYTTTCFNAWCKYIPSLKFYDLIFDELDQYVYGRIYYEWKVIEINTSYIEEYADTLIHEIAHAVQFNMVGLKSIMRDPHCEVFHAIYDYLKGKAEAVYKGDLNINIEWKLLWEENIRRL